MFQKADLSGLQAPDIAARLQTWHAQIRHMAASGAIEYDQAPSVDAAHDAMVLKSLDQLFTTTIPKVRSQRTGWSNALEKLLEALQEAKLLA
jgi:hypothetical protein